MSAAQPRAVSRRRTNAISQGNISSGVPSGTARNSSSIS
jgi:hypothetical protein